MAFVNGRWCLSFRDWECWLSGRMPKITRYYYDDALVEKLIGRAKAYNAYLHYKGFKKNARK